MWMFVLLQRIQLIILETMLDLMKEVLKKRAINILEEQRLFWRNRLLNSWLYQKVTLWTCLCNKAYDICNQK